MIKLTKSVSIGSIGYNTYLLNVSKNTSQAEECIPEMILEALKLKLIMEMGN